MGNIFKEKILKFILTNRIILGTNVIDTLVKFSNQFLLLPVFLLIWDTDIYGSWLSLLAITGITQVLISSTVVTYSLDLANSRNLKNKLINFSTNYLIIFFFFSVLIIFFSLIVFHFTYNYSNQLSFLDKKHFVLILLISSSLVDGLSSLKISMFRHYSNYSKYLLYERLMVVIKIIAILFCLLLLNFKPIDLSLTLAFVSIIFFILLNFNRKLNFNLNVNKIKKKYLKQIFDKVLKRMLISSGANFKYSYEILILSFFLKPNLLVNIVTIYTLARILLFLNSQLKLFFYENLSLKFIKKKNIELFRNHNLLILLSQITSIFFSILLFFFGKEIYEIWTLNKLDFNSNILILFLISINLRLLWVDKSFLINILNKLEYFPYINFLIVIIFSIITYLFVKYYSIYGFVISLIIYEIIMVFLSFYFHNKFFLKINVKKNTNI